jgi:hypothetical protein
VARGVSLLRIQGFPLLSRAVSRLLRNYGASRHRFVVDSFPGVSGNALYLAPPAPRRDEEGFARCTRHPHVTVLLITACRSDASHHTDCGTSAALAQKEKRWTSETVIEEATNGFTCVAPR